MKTLKIETTINDTSRLRDDIKLELEDYQIELIQIILKSLESLLKK